jgi:16S rRNA (guanine527-N7)-methyltransferase
VDSYERFIELLLASPVRLTAVTAGEARARHVDDALSGAEVLADEPGPLIDVGSGTGVPGMVLAIADPGREVVLLESNGRKAEALRSIASELALANVTVVAERAELAGRMPGHRDAYAVAVCRALARPPVAAELCLPFVRPGGLLVMWVGADSAGVEVVAAALEAAVERETTYEPGRRLLAIRKQAPTPDRFPRRDGMAAKRPLVT